MAPFIAQEEIKEKNEESLLENRRLIDFAQDFWDKRKSTK